MAIDFAYQVIKDLVGLAKMEEADAVDLGVNDLHQLVAMGIVEADDMASYGWSAQRKLFARTEGPDATHEVVWVTDKLRRTRRKIVRLNGAGNIELVLLRRKAG